MKLNRRGLLGLFGAAAVAPISLADAVAMPSAGRITRTLIDARTKDYAVLLIPKEGKPIFGPDVKSVMVVSERIPVDSGPGLVQMTAPRERILLEFEGFDPDRKNTFIGVQLIHIPSRTRHETLHFSSWAHVVPGDTMRVKVTTEV